MYKIFTLLALLALAAARPGPLSSSSNESQRTSTGSSESKGTSSSSSESTTKSYNRDTSENSNHGENNSDFFSMVGNFATDVQKGVQKEIRDAKQPIEATVADVFSSQCSNLKKIVGVAYEQISDKEPDLNKLKLVFLSRSVNITFDINTAATRIPKSDQFDHSKKLYIYIHGFTDDPSKEGFNTIRTALFKEGQYNVLALDGSEYIRWLYIRASTYVSFMGQKLGEVLAALVNDGTNAENIHIIGHSLGAHIASFTGKTLTKQTGKKVGRISGLDPAGPCFTNLDDDYKLNSTDATFVDVIHTDAGVFGLNQSCGQVDYWPNEGSQQPNCLLQACSHSRAWEYYAESVVNPKAFPAVRCDNWEAFKKGNCDSEISYMGHPSKPGTKGQYYLQTGGDSPYGLKERGIKYKNDEGFIKSIIG